MITKDNFTGLLKKLGFEETGRYWFKSVNGSELKIDFDKQKIIDSSTTEKNQILENYL